MHAVVLGLDRVLFGQDGVGSISVDAGKKTGYRIAANCAAAPRVKVHAPTNIRSGAGLAEDAIANGHISAGHINGLIIGIGRGKENGQVV